MSLDPNAHFDATVLDLIEHNPNGAIPATPSYQDARKRLESTHQIYASADHKGGFVTARSLSRLPTFHAANLDALRAGSIGPGALESNSAIFDRYVHSLPPGQQARAESFRQGVVGKAIRHRAKHVGDHQVVTHDPIHTLILVPGTGPHPGLPGNYLHGSAYQAHADDSSPWVVQVHDADDGAALCEVPTMEEALGKLNELLESAPFTLDELLSLGFHLN